MRRPAIHREASYGLDAKMTPMIDVIFQLLIFFLCTAGFAAGEAILPTDLPNAGAVQTAPARPRKDVEIVRVEMSGDENSLQLRVNGQPVTDMDELLQRLQAVAEVARDTPVVLDVEASVLLGHVIDAYDGALTSGLSSIHFAARRP